MADALAASLHLLVREALPTGRRWEAKMVRAEWQPGILNGRGGVEIEIDAVLLQGGAVASGRFIAWILAPRADLRDAILFTLPGTNG